MELPVSEEDPALEMQAFAATDAGKCSATIDDRVGGEALDKQVVQYIADSAATCNMTPDANGLTNYRECSRSLGLANGEEISIVGYSDVTVSFCTDHGWIRVEMNDVAHVPQLSYNLISLPSMTQKGHTYTGDKDGVTLKLEGGETVFFPLVGKLCRQYEYRPEGAGSMVDTACATIAPGKRKLPPPPLISTFSTARSDTLTRYYSKRRRHSKGSPIAGNFTSAGDVRWQRGCGSPSRGRRTPEQIKSYRGFLST